MKKSLLVVAILIFGSVAAQAQNTGYTVMSDAEYEKFLFQTIPVFTRLDRTLARRYNETKSGDPLAMLAEIRSIRKSYLDPPHWAIRSDEQDLCDDLQRLYINLTVRHISAPELNGLIFRLNDDILAQLASRHR